MTSARPLRRPMSSFTRAESTRPAWIPIAQWTACDLTDASKTYAAVTRVNPDLIVHCAAYNQVDLAQSQPEEAYRGNALATRNLALACQRFDTVYNRVISCI